MDLYKARKGNVEFYIQPDKIQDYDELGYDVIRVSETKVRNIENEMEKVAVSMQSMSGTASLKG